MAINLELTYGKKFGLPAYVSRKHTYRIIRELPYLIQQAVGRLKSNLGMLPMRTQRLHALCDRHALN